MSRARLEIPAAGPEREALRVELVLAEVAKLEQLPAFISSADVLALAQQIVRVSFNEPDPRSEAEREYQSALVGRAATVVPSTDPRDAGARASAVQDLVAAEQALGVVQAALDGVQAEHDAAVRARDERSVRAKDARSSFEARTSKDSPQRLRELRLNAEVAVDAEALAGAEVDVAARKLVEVRTARDAAAEAVAAARAAVAVIDVGAEARVIAAEDLRERMRRDQHAARRGAWLSKLSGSAPAGVDLPGILVATGVVDPPKPREEELKAEYVCNFSVMASRSPGGIACALTAAEVTLLQSLGVLMLPTGHIFKSADLSGRTIAGDAMKPPARPVELPSRAPTPTPTETDPRVPHTGTGPWV